MRSRGAVALKKGMTMKTLIKFGATLVACFVIVLPLGAGTIISTINGAAGFTGLGAFGSSVRAAEASWMQTGAFSSVNIAAEIDPGGSASHSHTFTCTPYLMTQVVPNYTF